MQLSAITDFYLTLSAREYAMQHLELGMRAQESLNTDLGAHLGEVASHMALGMRDYLWLAALGEARHARGMIAIHAPEIPYVTSRSDAYRVLYKYAPSENNIQVLHKLFADNWGGSYGGKRWDAIVNAVENYAILPALVYVDQVSSIMHNGGFAFNKIEAQVVMDIRLNIRSENMLHMLELAKSANNLVCNMSRLFDIGYEYTISQTTYKLMLRFAKVFHQLDWLNNYNLYKSNDRTWPYKPLQWGLRELTIMASKSKKRDDIEDFIDHNCDKCGIDSCIKRTTSGVYVCDNCIATNDLHHCVSCNYYTHLDTCACGTSIHKNCNARTCTNCSREVCKSCSMCCYKCYSILCNACGYQCAGCSAVMCAEHQPQDTRCGIEDYCGNCIHEHALECAICLPVYCIESRGYFDDIKLCAVCDKHKRLEFMSTNCANCNASICEHCHYYGYSARHCEKCKAVYCNTCRDTHLKHIDYGCRRICENCLGESYHLCIEHGDYTLGKCACGNIVCNECKYERCHKRGCDARLCKTCLDQYKCSSCLNIYCIEHTPRYKSKCGSVFCSPTCVAIHYRDGNCNREGKNSALCEKCHNVHTEVLTCKCCNEVIAYCKNCNQHGSCNYCNAYMCMRCSIAREFYLESNNYYYGSRLFCGRECLQSGANQLIENGYASKYHMPKELISTKEVVPDNLNAYIAQVNKYLTK